MLPFKVPCKGVADGGGGETSSIIAACLLHGSGSPSTSESVDLKGMNPAPRAETRELGGDPEQSPMPRYQHRNTNQKQIEPGNEKHPNV